MTDDMSIPETIATNMLSRKARTWQTGRKHAVARAFLRVLADARVLVHAYETDNRPPADVVARYRKSQP